MFSVSVGHCWLQHEAHCYSLCSCSAHSSPGQRWIRLWLRMSPKSMGGRWVWSESPRVSDNVQHRFSLHSNSSSFPVLCWQWNCSDGCCKMWTVLQRFLGSSRSGGRRCLQILAFCKLNICFTIWEISFQETIHDVATCTFLNSTQCASFETCDGADCECGDAGCYVEGQETPEPPVKSCQGGIEYHFDADWIHWVCVNDEVPDLSSPYRNESAMPPNTKCYTTHK